MYRTLEKIREQRLEMDKLNDQLARISVAYKSQNYDGMPKGCAGDAMASRIIAKEFIEHRRDMMVQDLKALEEEARRAIEKLPPNLYAFCVHYFIGACTVHETCRIIDRDETTFYRYKKDVRKMLGG